MRFAYFETGSYPNYIVELNNNGLLTHDAAQSSVAEAAAHGFAKGGEHGLFQAQLAEQRKLYEQGKLSPFTRQPCNGRRILFGKAGSQQKTRAVYLETSSATFANMRHNLQLEIQTLDSQ